MKSFDINGNKLIFQDIEFNESDINKYDQDSIIYSGEVMSIPYLLAEKIAERADWNTDKVLYKDYESINNISAYKNAIKSIRSLCNMRYIIVIKQNHEQKRQNN